MLSEAWRSQESCVPGLTASAWHGYKPVTGAHQAGRKPSPDPLEPHRLLRGPPQQSPGRSLQSHLQPPPHVNALRAVIASCPPPEARHDQRRAATVLEEQAGACERAVRAPWEMEWPSAHMPPAMMMGVTDEKNRACVMLVVSMPSTQKQKCSARAPPDSSISRALLCVRCLSSAAACHGHKLHADTLRPLYGKVQRHWISLGKDSRWTLDS